MSRKLEDGQPAGYGEEDRTLATSLAEAVTGDEADEIARAGGFKDAADARDWLESRS